MVVISTRSFILGSFCRRNAFLLSRSFASNSKTNEIASASEEEGKKFLKVAIIGVPNAGKSTLINKLMEFEVCPTSRRAHTTRVGQQAVFLEKETQIVLADTPGLVNNKEIKKFSMSEEFVITPENSVKEAHVIAALHSIENKILRNKLDVKVINILRKFPSKPVVLVINKIDKIKGRQKLLDTVYHLCSGHIDGTQIPRTKKEKKKKMLVMDHVFENTRAKLNKTYEAAQRQKLRESSGGPAEPSYEEYEKLDENGRVVRGWPNFKEVFLISALKGEGVGSLKEHLMKSARLAPWEFDDKVMTDCPPATLAVRTVKAKLLEHMRDEIPYQLNPKLEFWDTNEKGILRIIMGVEAKKEDLIAYIIAKERMGLVKKETEAILSELLNVPVDLYVHVSAAPDQKKKKQY